MSPSQSRAQSTAAPLIFTQQTTRATGRWYLGTVTMHGTPAKLPVLGLSTESPEGYRKGYLRRSSFPPVPKAVAALAGCLLGSRLQPG